MTNRVKFHMGSFTHAHENWLKRWVNFMYETSHVKWSDERKKNDEPDVTCFCEWNFIHEKMMDQMWHFCEWNFIYEKIMDQIWQFREWSFLYKKSLFSLFFMNEFMCMKTSFIVHRSFRNGIPSKYFFLGMLFLCS